MTTRKLYSQKKASQPAKATDEITMLGVGRATHGRERFIKVRLVIDGKPKTRILERASFVCNPTIVAERELGLVGRDGVSLIQGMFKEARLQEPSFDVATVPGWWETSFVKPTGYPVGPAIPTRLPHAHEVAYKYRLKGSASDQARLKALTVGNHLMIVCFIVGLMGPCMGWLDQATFILQLASENQVGKSVIAAMAGSIWGRGEGTEPFFEKWILTDNGMERIAAAHSGTLLVLDETSLQLDRKNAGMMLATMVRLVHGEGKLRFDDQARKRWRESIISTSNALVGEICLKAENFDLLQTLTGRLVDVFLEADKVFLNLHGHKRPEDLCAEIAGIVQRSYGKIGQAWLEALVAEEQKEPLASRDYLKARVKYYRNEQTRGLGLDNRTEGILANIYAVGRLAKKLGIVSWSKDEIIAALHWLEDRHIEARKKTAEVQGARVLSVERKFDLLAAYIRDHKAEFVRVDPAKALPASHDHKTCAGYRWDDGLIMLPIERLKDLFGSFGYQDMLADVRYKTVFKRAKARRSMTRLVGKGQRENGFVLDRKEMARLATSAD
ncbi:MAG: DUF927 domain-containing protein [Rhizobiales bacterium]|nr:DUF927 domain-containing protein [Hyphomicrobiales bacterium]